MPGPFLARLGVLQHLRIEVAVAVHRLLEDLDRAGQCADLVGAIGMRNLDIFGAFGDPLDGGGDSRKRPRDRAGDDQDTDADQNQRQAAETGQQEGQLAVDLGLLGDPLAAFGIDLGKRFEILVEGGTHRAIGIVVAPFAAGGVTDLDAAANEFLAEFDELLDAFLEDGELLGVICLDDGFPVLDDAKDLVVELEQPIAVLLHGGGFRRHVDAPGFHHDGIDQRIDALDVERGEAGGLDRFGEFRAPAGVVIGKRGDGRGQKRKQGEDRVQLGCERKAGPDRLARARQETSRLLASWLRALQASRRRPVSAVTAVKAIM